MRGRAIFLFILLFSLTFASEPFAQMKRRGPLPAKPLPPPSKEIPQQGGLLLPQIQPSDLSIEKIYLKECKIHVGIVNRGKGEVSNEDYRNGKLKVLYRAMVPGAKGQTSTFGLSQVDPKRILKSPGKMVEFDTGITLGVAKIYKVTAKFVDLKDDARKVGKKVLINDLVLPDDCVSKVIKPETRRPPSGTFPRPPELEVPVEKPGGERIPPQFKQKEQGILQQGKKGLLRKGPLMMGRKGIRGFKGPMVSKGLERGFPRTKGPLPRVVPERDFSLSNVELAGMTPRFLSRPQPPQPEGAIRALMFNNDKGPVVEEILYVGTLPGFRITCDMDELTEAVGDFEQVRVKVSFVDEEGSHQIYDVTKERGEISTDRWGRKVIFEVSTQELVSTLQQQNLWSWTQPPPYLFEIEGEVTYSDDGREETRKLNVIHAYLTFQFTVADQSRRYGPELWADFEIEDTRFTFQEAPTGVSVPQSREVTFRVKVKNHSPGSTIEVAPTSDPAYFSETGRQAYAQGMQRGRFYVVVYRCVVYGCVRSCEQIQTFVAGPLDSGEEWISDPITDVSPASFGVQYKVIADPYDFIIEWTGNFHQTYSKLLPPYWQTQNIDFSITSVRMEPEVVNEGQQACYTVEVENRSSQTLPVVFAFMQPGKFIRCVGPDLYPSEIIPTAVQPGRSSHNIGCKPFRPPFHLENEVGLVIRAAAVYATEEGYSALHTLDEIEKNFAEVEGGYSLTEVPPKLLIKAPREGDRYQSKTTPPQIIWRAYDPQGLEGTVKLYYRMKDEGGDWSQWQLIDEVPVTRNIYHWHPELTVGEKQTQVKVEWYRPGRQPITDESDVFIVDFQRDYSAYGLEIETPNAQTVWHIGDEVEISWRIDPSQYSRIRMINLIKLDNSGNPTGDWWRIAQNISINSSQCSYRNNGSQCSYTWQVHETSFGRGHIEPGIYVIEIYPEGSGYLGGGRKLWSETFRIEPRR